jgi:outer membrane protein insertion porin family
VGDTVNGPDVQEAIQRLFSSGEFSDVRVRVTPSRPAVFYIDVVERPLIGSYGFRGLDHVDQQTIRDSARLVGGAAIDPSKVARARVLIRTMLADAGFPRAEVDTTYVPDSEGLDQFDLVFDVEEGPRLALARVDFTGNRAVSSSELRGAMSTSEEGFFWFRPGELHQLEYRRDLTDRVPGFYGSKGYIDARVIGDTVVVDTVSGKGRIEIAVSEGDLYRLRRFQISQNRRFSSGQLSEYFAPFRDGVLDEFGEPTGDLPVFDRAAFDEATRDVSDLYRDAGYLQAQVEPLVERFPADSLHEFPTVEAGWNIIEGQPSYIRSVKMTTARPRQIFLASAPSLGSNFSALGTETECDIGKLGVRFFSGLKTLHSLQGANVGHNGPAIFHGNYRALRAHGAFAMGNGVVNLAIGLPFNLIIHQTANRHHPEALYNSVTRARLAVAG